MSMQVQETQRRETRYNVEIEVHLTDGKHEWASRTREISRGGLFVFACPAPPVGKELRVTLYPRGGAVIHLEGSVRYRLPDIGAGISVSGDETSIQRYQEFVNHQRDAVQAWHAIRGFLAQEDVHASSGYYEARELVPLGERCQALRVLFARHGGLPPPTGLSESRWLGGEVGARLELEGETLLELSSEKIGLKLHPDDSLREVFVARTEHEAFFAVLFTGVAPEDLTLYRLGGRELIAVAAGGRTIYPHFTTEELLRIRSTHSDILGSARVSEVSFPRATASKSLPEEGNMALGHVHLDRWNSFDEDVAQTLLRLFSVRPHETRVYSIRGVSREVKFLPGLLLKLRRTDDSDRREQPAQLLHDGKRLCVIVEDEGPTLRVRPLEGADELRIVSVETPGIAGP